MAGSASLTITVIQTCCFRASTRWAFESKVFLHVSGATHMGGPFTNKMTQWLTEAG